MNTNAPNFIDNPAIAGKEDKYITVMINVPAALKSWKKSLFSFEWLDENENLRSPGALQPDQQAHLSRTLDTVCTAYG